MSFSLHSDEQQQPRITSCTKLVNRVKSVCGHVVQLLSTAGGIGSAFICALLHHISNEKSTNICGGLFAEGRKRATQLLPTFRQKRAKCAT